MPIHVCGINHTTAPVALRERVFVSSAVLEQQVSSLLATGVAEALILSTCNRTEVYAVCDDARRLLAFLADLGEMPTDTLRPVVYHYNEMQAVDHLFHVAAGLDSQVLGEPHILGQVRAAYRRAAGAGGCGPQLNRLFTQAIAVGKRARAETAIGEGSATVASVAVALARELLPTIGRHPILILGAGEIAERTARHLADIGARSILVANRTFAHAQHLADRLGGEAMHYEALVPALREADIVISSTSAPHYVLRASDVAAALRDRPDRPLCCIDIAVPRDVDPAVGDIPGVRLYTLDDLRHITRQAAAQRQAEVPRVEAVIAEELARWRAQCAAADAAPQIAGLMQDCRRIRDEELRRMDPLLAAMSPAERRIIERLAHDLTRKLTHAALCRLKNQPTEPETEPAPPPAQALAGVQQ